MRRRLLGIFVALGLVFASPGQVAATGIAAGAAGAAGGSQQNVLSPTDSTKIPHYYGPYPNWANSPQALADAVVTFTPASAAPVVIGNALTDRASATDDPGPTGLAPALVIETAPLPAGTLTEFQVWNQATAGAAAAPSAGGTFHAYVLRPTGTASQYSVVADSGVLTVPGLASPGVSELDTFAANVAVKAGDVLGFYGSGVPYDTTGADVVVSPLAAAPAAADTITVGDPALPVASSARTYSFAAKVTPAAVDPGVGAEATAVVDPATSGITSVTVTKPGSGYLVPPAVSIDAPGLTPTKATAHAVISRGVVSSVTVAEQGFGFTTPSVAVSGGNPTAPAILTASGGVDDLTLVSGGDSYTSPSVQISLPDLAGGTPATASVTMSNGVITGVTIANPGSGYTKAPTVTIVDGNNPPSNPAVVKVTINILQIDVTDGGAGYTSAPDLTISDTTGSGANATATATVSVFGAVTDVVVDSPGSGYITPGIKKFIDTLPGVGESQKNNLGQYIPVATPDTTTYPGSDYYEIGLVQYRMKFSSDLPASLLRGYVQLSTSVVPGKHIALTNANLDPNAAATPVLLNGQQVYGVDNPHYLGPAIVATKNRPVRVVFRNLLPTGADGNLFLPVDTSFMGAGDGPDAMMLNKDGTPMDMTQNDNTVTDAVRNPRCAQTPKPADCYSENRATIHLHGGITPWISDGTPHQWITPAGETTNYPQGVAVQNVPDMNLCGAVDDGCQTFFYTNQQSARLLFYHDHAWGITRLNVYAGEAAPYLITDDAEKKLVSSGLIPDANHTKELVIQDKTFVPSATQMALQDPTWDPAKWGGMGNLWYEHVYMPAQNPNDPSGMSAYGRWFYGPYFWPPSTSKYGPIANPYYDANCKLDDPATWQYQVAPYCEPPTIPGTPNVSSGMEQFNDTPIVNGTAYPKTTVDPTAYRLRILNAANDRFWNLQWYVADPRTGTLSEVALDPKALADAQTNPNAFPTPDTKWSPAGPSWVQIGTEGGFLSAPAVIPNQPITWITDQTRFDFGNVDQHSLLLAPAERADVIVDFSQFRGKTLILYNDAPAAFPGRIPCYDYYTGGPDMTPGCAPSTLPGYGPNTRTIMRVDVSMAAPTVAFDRPNTTSDGLGRLQAAFAHHADGSGVFESGQNPIVVGQAAYNGAYGSNFVSGSWCNDPKASPTASCDGLARISDQGGQDFKFDTLSGTQISLPIQPKALHDETNSTTFDDYGRMTANMGVEAPGATPLTQNIVLYPYVNPATEVFDESNGPDSLNVTPISTSTDGTQIWKITHNGVDTHPIHFHLYDIQILNRVTWDNIILPPDANELGWKDTIRVSPLEDTYVAVRPIVPKVPFGVPDSHRLLNPMMPEGARGTVAGMVMGPNGTAGIEAGFNNTDVNGNPINPIVNEVKDFGWEYVWHCHILAHEEMDMMRPQIVRVPFALADAPALTASSGPGTVTLNWTDGTPVDYANPATWGSPKGEVGYRVERAQVTDGVVGAYTRIADVAANQVTFTDTTASGAVSYRVSAWNEAGDSWSNVVAAGPLSLSISGFPSPVTAGTAGTVTVTALDPLGNTATAYTGTVHFTSSDPAAILPADHTFTAGDAGAHTFDATLFTAGTQSITATDTASPSMNATQSGILVNPAAAASLTIAGMPSPIAAGAPGSVTVKALDQYGNVAAGYAGTVHFTSSDVAAILPADYTFTAGDAGVHVFPITLKTAGTQSITVTDTVSAAMTATQSGIVVTASPAVSFTVTGMPSPVTAGTPGTITVTALDAYGNVATGYTGSVRITSSDAKADLPAVYAFVPGDAGVHTFIVTLRTAGTQSITATDTVTAALTGSQTGIVVNAAAPAAFSVTGFPSPVVAGVSGTVTVTALDAFGNTATGYTGTVHFTSSDPAAMLPADYAFTAGDAGSHVFSVTLTTAGTQSITVTDTATASMTGTQSGIVVNAAAAATISVSGVASPITAGAAGSVTVRVLDAYGNAATGYTGTVHFTSSDAAAVLPADYTFTGGDAGVHTFGLTFKTAGLQSVTATDTVTAALTGTQAGIVVTPGAAASVRVSGFPSPVTAGNAGTITATVLDAFGNTVAGYTGTVRVTSTDAKAVLPANYAFTAGDAGVHTFPVTLKTAATQSITVTDTATASVTGSQTGIVVNAAAAASMTIGGYVSPATAGTVGTVTVRLLDAYGNVATGYRGTAHFTSTDSQAVLPANYPFTAGDAGVHNFGVTLRTVGVQSITATDTVTPSLTATQSAIAVNPAAAARFSVSGIASPITAGTSGTLVVRALDAYGNTATGYRGTVRLTSTDAKAVLPANYTFTAAEAGVHVFNVTLRTAGVQSVTVTDTVTATITGSQTGIVVNPAAMAAFAVSGIPSPMTAGTAATLSVTAVDAFGNQVPSYTGTIRVSSTDPRAILPANYTFTALDAGFHRFSVTLRTAGTQSVTVTDTVVARLTGAQTGIVVNPGAASTMSIATAATTVAGVSKPLTVTLRDANGNVATGYRGTVRFTSTDTQAVLPANYTFTATDAGTHSFTITLKSSGARSVTVTDTVNTALTASQIVTVSPGTMTRFTLAMVASVYSGTRHSVVVTARDAYGNVVPTYRGTIHFSSTDTRATLPANYTFTAGDAGIHTFVVVMRTRGTQTITVWDIANTTLRGSISVRVL